MKKLKDKLRTPFGSRGCLGCGAKPQLITAVDEPSKGHGIQGQSVNKPSVPEDFWSTGTYKMDNSAIRFQRSVSSTSASNLPLDPHNSAGGKSNPTEFVNHGLLLWNQTRQQWTGDERFPNRGQVQDDKISWDATYESLLGTNKPCPQPIPLSEMVDFLVDVWEHEGLYD